MPVPYFHCFTLAHQPDIQWVDLGNDSFCTSLDQRGYTRPKDGNRDGLIKCDAGAIELTVDLIFVDGFESMNLSDKK